MEQELGARAGAGAGARAGATLPAACGDSGRIATHGRLFGGPVWHHCCGHWCLYRASGAHPRRPSPPAPARARDAHAARLTSRLPGVTRALCSQQLSSPAGGRLRNRRSSDALANRRADCFPASGPSGKPVVDDIFVFLLGMRHPARVPELASTRLKRASLRSGAVRCPLSAVCCRCPPSVTVTVDRVPYPLRSRLFAVLCTPRAACHGARRALSSSNIRPQLPTSTSSALAVACAGSAQRPRPAHRAPLLTPFAHYRTTTQHPAPAHRAPRTARAASSALHRPTAVSRPGPVQWLSGSLAHWLAGLTGSLVHWPRRALFAAASASERPHSALFPIHFASPRDRRPLASPPPPPYPPPLG